jgi:uncharacterized protein
LETIDLLSIFTIALLGAFGHCIGMCGGIVIAYSSAQSRAKNSKFKQAIGHLSYSFGRIQTYMLLGILFGYLGGVSTFSNRANGILLTIAGLAMILTGLSLSGKIKFLSYFNNPAANSKWYHKSIAALLQDDSAFSLFILGMLNGLLPCGFVYFFAIAAAGTASPFWGGVVMLVFGISTIPAMFSLGFFVNLFQKEKFRRTMVQLAAIAVIVYGCYTLYSGFEYLTDPQKSILDCHQG